MMKRKDANHVFTTGKNLKPGFPRSAFWAGLLGISLVPMVGLHAQQASESQTILANNGEMQAVIRRQSDTTGQPVIVPIGTTALIDTNFAVHQALIGNEKIARVLVLSPRQVMISGEAIGRSLVVLSNEDGEQVALEVIVQPDLEMLKRIIEETVPYAEVNLKAVGATVFVGGRVPDAETASRVMQIASMAVPGSQNQMVVAGERQVLLRCTVAEVSKSASRQMRIDAWASFQDNAPRVNAIDISGQNPAIIGPIGGVPGIGGTSFFGNRFLFGSDPGGFQTTISSQSLQMNLFVRALQDNGLLRILAEPNLVARSGSQAEFLAGGEFPVPVPQASGAGTTITIEWKDFGVILRFIPTVIGHNEIRLQMAAEVSEIDFSTAVQTGEFIVPGVSQRRVDTTVEMTAGGTLAIAGLLNERTRSAIEKLPGLGELPVLGSLFRSVQYQQDKTELIVLITPDLVSSMMPDQVPPVPGENTSHPNDWQLYGLGQIEGEAVSTDPARTGALQTTPAPMYRKYSSPPDQLSLHGPWGPSDGDQDAF